MNNYDPNGMQIPNTGYDPNVRTPFQQPYTYPAYNYGMNMQPRLNTNAMFVTSLDEALIKTDKRNSDMIYFNQDKNEFYRVKVDTEGRKTWATFQYIVPEQQDSTPVTKAEIAELLARVEALENAKLAPKRKTVKEVNENAESDG